MLGFQPNHSLTVWRWWNARTAETERLEALSEINAGQIFENGGDDVISKATAPLRCSISTTSAG